MERRADPALAQAARALAGGHALAALKAVALRSDARGTALRGIALAQLGEYPRARALLRRAAGAFGARAPLDRARCLVAEAEVTLAMRDLRGRPAPLDALARRLARMGDAANARQARLVAARWSLLIGRLGDARAALAAVDLGGASPTLLALYHLGRAEIAMREIRARDAARALETARVAAATARVAALSAEIDRASAALNGPCARLGRRGTWTDAALAVVERTLASNDLVVDGIRRTVRAGGAGAALSRRPVLFALARALAEAWPDEAPRARLMADAFGARLPNPAFRARLRVEVGRLRVALRGLAAVTATPGGFRLAPAGGRAVAVLAPSLDDGAALAVTIRALIQDGAAWSTAALAQAAGVSQRTLQRTLRELAARGAVRPLGGGRTRRWVAAPITGFATTLLLPAAPGTN
ncbi:MAG: helix-turn-helix domain-containing protein [Polyangia bacterium]